MAFEKVFIRHGAYHYDLGRIDGKRRSRVLCRVTDGEPAMYEALARFLNSEAKTINDLLTEFLAKGMRDLSPRTQNDYTTYAGTKLRKHLGHMPIEALKPTHIAQYLEKRKESGAAKLANKEIACLSSAFEYGQRVGFSSGNPCRQVRRNKVKNRERYVRHNEFLQIFEVAPDHVQDLMAGIYLMELRPHEARDLTRQHSITPDGVLFEESKTGKIKLIEWSPALQFFLTRSTSRFPNSPHVFTNSLGGKWTVWAMASAMQRAREKAGQQDRWTWHDLRAKGESDHKDGGMDLLPLYKRARRYRPVR